MGGSVAQAPPYPSGGTQTGAPFHFAHATHLRAVKSVAGAARGVARGVATWRWRRRHGDWRAALATLAAATQQQRDMAQRHGVKTFSTWSQFLSQCGAQNFSSTRCAARAYMVWQRGVAALVVVRARRGVNLRASADGKLQ